MRHYGSPYDSINPTVDGVVDWILLSQLVVFGADVAIYQTRNKVIVDEWQTEQKPQVARPYYEK